MELLRGIGDSECGNLHSRYTLKTKRRPSTCFLRSMGRIQRFIEDVDYAVTRERSSRRWVVTNLQPSVPTVTIRPLLGDAETIDVVGKGLREISRGPDGPPEFFTEKALSDLKNMKSLFIGSDRVRFIFCSLSDVDRVVIEADTCEKAQRILTGGHQNLGSLEGDLDEINLHGTARFTIWDRVSRAPVRCSFPKSDEWIEKSRRCSGRE